jgi:histidinol-phosphate/aromatic aminotransferase/cobyric acid decarboxylase-like protein
LTSPASGSHGGDGRLVGAAYGLDPASVLDLSASLNPFAPDPAAVVARHLDATLGRYPDAIDAAVATTELAEALGVDAGRVLVTNGGAEAIALVATVLGRGWVSSPEFSLYARHLSVLDPDGPEFRSDPNNPTGALAPPGASAGVWDEAFYPLATGRWSRRSPLAGPSGPEDPAVVVGSLTKVLACPGLRLGYVIAPADDGEALGVGDLLGRLAERQARWSVSALALASLPDLLGTVDLAAWSAAMAAARAELVGVLAAHGLSARPSAANFVLVDGAAGLRDALAPHGVVVRDCSSFGLTGSVRIAVPDADGLARLDAALRRVGGRAGLDGAGLGGAGLGGDDFEGALR